MLLHRYQFVIETSINPPAFQWLQMPRNGRNAVVDLYQIGSVIDFVFGVFVMNTNEGRLSKSISKTRTNDRRG